VYEADRILVSRMLAGDQRAFDEFFNTTAPRLAAFVARRSGLDPASVEDIVQDTLVKAVRSLGSYRGEAAVFTWLTQICKHQLADDRRKAARRPLHDRLDESESADFVAPQLRIPAHREPAAEVEAQRRREAIVRALNDLPEHYAHALEVKYADGLSVDEVAGILGLSTIAAQSLLARARDAFRARWAAETDTAAGDRQGD
jgi:RNA polymerase sigma-70 factor, ECF subfamily